jgi:small nuclear ribonucleoprotein (snRNP)-like protein
MYLVGGWCLIYLSKMLELEKYIRNVIILAKHNEKVNAELKNVQQCCNIFRK